MKRPTLAQQTRLTRLLPNNYPRYVRVYDNEGKTADRYTVVFTGRYPKGRPPEFLRLTMSENPFSPKGVCILDSHEYNIDVDEKEHRWSPSYGKSNHLGKRIHWHELPETCQQAALHAYREIWELWPTQKTARQ